MTTDEICDSLYRIKTCGEDAKMFKALTLAIDFVQAFDELPEQIEHAQTSGHEIYMRGFNDGKDAALRIIEKIRREILDT